MAENANDVEKEARDAELVRSIFSRELQDGLGVLMAEQERRLCAVDSESRTSSPDASMTPSPNEERLALCRQDGLHISQLPKAYPPRQGLDELKRRAIEECGFKFAEVTGMSRDELRDKIEVARRGMEGMRKPRPSTSPRESDQNRATLGRVAFATPLQPDWECDLYADQNGVQSSGSIPKCGATGERVRLEKHSH